MTASTFDDTDHTCRCTDDPDLDRLRDLIACGMDQHAASTLIWGDAATTRNGVRAALSARLPWLRLPEGGAA